MKSETKSLSGEELLALVRATGMDETCARGTFDAHSQREMVRAQDVLIENGYYLSQSTMDEGHFYRQVFVSGDGWWPYWVALRYLTDGVQVPSLALMSRRGREVIQFTGGAYRTTHATGTSDASKMVADWVERFGNRPYFWMPVFEGSQLARF